MSFLGTLFRRSSSLLDTNSLENQESQDVEDGLNAALDFLENGPDGKITSNLRPKLFSQVTLSTPAPTPPIESTISSASLRKVVFQAVKDTDFHYSSSPTRVLSPLRPLPPTDNLSPRSILKPSNQSESVTITKPSLETFEDMLSNVTQKLATGDQRNSIDAYSAFLNALHAKPTSVETTALLDSTRSLLEFVHRDIRNQSQQNTQLTNWALKFLSNLVRYIPLSNQTEFEILAELLDHAIFVLEEPTTPKVIVHHHMLYLCQRFNPEVFTQDRASKVITCLSKIHERVQGSNVKVYRIIIYQQMLDVNPSIMISHASDWLPNLFNSLLSGKNEVRTHATNFGIQTSLRYYKQLHKPVEEILTRTVGEGTFSHLFVRQLEKLLDHEDKEMALIVPRIWSIIVLFLRPRLRILDFWMWFKPWLLVCSKAMNSNNKNVKMEAYNAWKKFIYAIMPDNNTLPQVRAMLKSPYADSLHKCRELHQGIGRALMSSYLCLLYYSLRPNLSFEIIDLSWDEYVAAILKTFVTPDKESPHVYCAASIIHSLFRSQEKFQDQRFNSVDPFEIDELPKLDPLWVRSRVSKVLPLVETILMHPASWKHRESNQYDENASEIAVPALATWISLLDSIQEAGSKEITISTGLKATIASIMNTLHNVGKHLEQNFSSTESAKIFKSLVNLTISKLGLANFMEKMLIRNPDSRDFEIAATPSTRPTPGSKSPIVHLIELQASLGLSLTFTDAQAHLECVQQVIRRGWDSLSLRTNKFTFAIDVLETFYTKFDGRAVPQLVVQVVKDILLLSEVITNPNRCPEIDENLSIKELEDVVLICKYSCCLTGEIPTSLYEYASESARRSGGDGGLLIAVTEPHASMIHDIMSVDDGSKYNVLMDYTQMIINRDDRPRNWAAIDRAYKRFSLRPASNFASKYLDLEFTKVSSLITLTLAYAYSNLKSSSNAEVFTVFLDSLYKYISRTSAISRNTLIKQIQSGLSVVFCDAESNIINFSGETGKAPLFKSVKSFWTNIITFLESEPSINSKYYEELIYAGLSNPRISIANVTIKFWNRIVKNADESFEYSDRILHGIKQLSLRASIKSSPSANVAVSEKVDSNRLAHVDYSHFTDDSVPSTHISPVYKHQKPLMDSPSSIKKTQTHKAETPKRKLRHDDSQIVFEAIESSPYNKTETQNFTEHQKEIKERQTADAVLFSDMNKTSENTQSMDILDLIPVDSDVPFQHDDMSSDAEQVEDGNSTPPTPPLSPVESNPTGDEDDENVSPSSPMVASLNRKRSRTSRESSQNGASQTAEVDVPSSPPLAASKKYMFSNSGSIQPRMSDSPSKSLRFARKEGVEPELLATNHSAGIPAITNDPTVASDITSGEDIHGSNQVSEQSQAIHLKRRRDEAETRIDQIGEKKRKVSVVEPDMMKNTEIQALATRTNDGSMEVIVATPTNIISRFEHLLQEARSMDREWTEEDRYKIADISFELQALSRGR